MEVINTNYTLEQTTNIIGESRKSNHDMVAGTFSFKANDDRKNHCILLSSRFNDNSREENGPFPGWFLQIVGNKFSLAFGNGKKWTSVISKKAVVNNTWHHVSFSLNNKTKRIELYFDNEMSYMENVIFRRPCDYINVCALNNKKEFQFNGEIKQLKIGDKLKEVEISEEEEDSVINNINNSKDYIKTIHTCIKNFKEDIESLKQVKEQIETWKYRGLQLDTALLDKQIEDYEKNIMKFQNDMKDHLKSLHIFDTIIKGTNDYEEKDLENKGPEELYDIYLNNLYQDIDVIHNAEDVVNGIKNKGVDIGNSLEKMDNQRNTIIDIIGNTEIDLLNRLEIISDMMQVITIDEK